MGHPLPAVRNGFVLGACVGIGAQFLHPPSEPGPLLSALADVLDSLGAAHIFGPAIFGILGALLGVLYMLAVRLLRGSAEPPRKPPKIAKALRWLLAALVCALIIGGCAYYLAPMLYGG